VKIETKIIHPKIPKVPSKQHDKKVLCEKLKYLFDLVPGL